MKEITMCFPTLLMLKTIPEKFQAKLKLQHYEIAIKEAFIQLHIYSDHFVS